MITADDLAALARSLQSGLANEVKIRNGIGRAYYAAFHYCSYAADTWCGELAPGEGADKGGHIKLFMRLQDHSKDSRIDDDLRFMAEEAKKLRDLRVTADYELDKTVTSKLFSRGLHHMSEVKRVLDSIPATLNPV